MFSIIFSDSSEETLTETNTTPDFEFIQESNIYMVFVLDVSGSMVKVFSPSFQIKRMVLNFPILVNYT
jgi:hypothetical protein